MALSVIMVAGLELTRTTSGSLLLEGAAGLSAGVVKLGRLADDDRPRTDDQHLFDVPYFSAWSFPPFIISTNRSNKEGCVLRSRRGLRMELDRKAGIFL